MARHDPLVPAQRTLYRAEGEGNDFQPSLVDVLLSGLFPGLCIHPSRDGSTWTVSHLLSGCSVSTGAVDRHDAQGRALHLAKLGDWQRDGKAIYADIAFANRARSLVTSWDGEPRSRKGPPDTPAVNVA